MRGKKRTLLATPAVLAEAKAQTGCSSIAGFELEDSGGVGTTGSHWELYAAYG